MFVTRAAAITGLPGFELDRSKGERREGQPKAKGEKEARSSDRDSSSCPVSRSDIDCNREGVAPHRGEGVRQPPERSRIAEQKICYRVPRLNSQMPRQPAESLPFQKQHAAAVAVRRTRRRRSVCQFWPLPRANAVGDPSSQDWRQRRFPPTRHTARQCQNANLRRRSRSHRVVDRRTWMGYGRLITNFFGVGQRLQILRTRTLQQLGFCKLSFRMP